MYNNIITLYYKNYTRLSIGKHLSFSLYRVWRKNLHAIYKHKKFLSFFFGHISSLSICSFLSRARARSLCVYFCRRFSFKTNRSSLRVPVLVRFCFYPAFISSVYHDVSSVYYYSNVSTKPHRHYQDFEN